MGRYYKFYFDGGLRFAMERFPHYRINHKALNSSLVGITEAQIDIIVRPDERLRTVLEMKGDPSTP